MAEKEENPQKINTTCLEKLAETDYSSRDSVRTFYFKGEDNRIVAKRVYYSEGGQNTISWSYYSGVLSPEELKEVAPKCFGSVGQFEECRFLRVPWDAVIYFNLAKKFGELGAPDKAKKCLDDVLNIFQGLYQEQKDIIVERYLKPALKKGGCLELMSYCALNLPVEKRRMFLDEMLGPALPDLDHGLQMCQTKSVGAC